MSCLSMKGRTSVTRLHLFTSSAESPTGPRWFHPRPCCRAPVQVLPQGIQGSSDEQRPTHCAFRSAVSCGAFLSASPCDRFGPKWSRLNCTFALQLFGIWKIQRKLPRTAGLNLGLQCVHNCRKCPPPRVKLEQRSQALPIEASNVFLVQSAP